MSLAPARDSLPDEVKGRLFGATITTLYFYLPSFLQRQYALPAPTVFNANTAALTIGAGATLRGTGASIHNYGTVNSSGTGP